MPDPVEDLLALAGSQPAKKAPPKPPPPAIPAGSRRPVPTPLRVNQVSASTVQAPVASQTAETPAIEGLAEVGKEISKCYQLIEDAWKVAESRLALAHVPTEVRIPYSESEDGWDSTEFAYARHRGEWRICMVFCHLNPQTGDSEVTYRPITECPVEQRLEMFDHFQKLHTAVLKTTKDFVPKVADRVTKFLASLESLDG